MKYALVIAFDCNPYLESESLISFNTAYYLSKTYNVVVLTRIKCQHDLEKWKKENPDSALSFEYFDCPKYKKIFEKSKGIIQLFFLSKYIDAWMKKLPNVIKKLDLKYHFSIIDRVTPNSYRKVPDLSQFKNAFKIMGPVGGAQEIPDGLMCLAKGKNHFVEWLHRYSNNKVLKSEKFKTKLDTFDKVYCCNYETLNALSNIIDERKLTLLPDVAIDEKLIVDSTDRLEDDKMNGPVKLLWVGRFIFRKGLDLLIDALTLIPNDNYHLYLVGDGEYSKHIKDKVNENGLDNKITFVGRVPHEKVYDYFKKCDYFVFPSLRESGGSVLVEAQTFGLPVIALDIGGASVILPRDCNYLVPANGTYQEIVSDFSSGIKNAVLRGYDKDLKCCCIKNVKGTMTWEKKIKRLINNESLTI